MTERKMLHCLRKFGDVEIIYFQKKKHKSMWLALVFFSLDILRSSSKGYRIYFSRGLVTCFFLVFLKCFIWKSKKVVYRTVLPFASTEVKYLGYNRVEAFVRYCLFRFFEKTVLPQVDAIIVPFSEYTNELAQFGVEKNKIYVVPLYVEEEFFKQPLKEASDENFKFCCVSGFHLYHDLYLLIRAFEKFVENEDNAELVLVGEGVLRSSMEREVSKRKLESAIKFSGKLLHGAIPVFLSKMDAFVNLSLTPAISTSLLEAAAAGKPIITTKKSEYPILGHYFKHGKEIYMINSASPTEIAKAMRSLYEDIRLRNTLGIGAREVALRHFSKVVAVRQVSKLLSEIS